MEDQERPDDLSPMYEPAEQDSMIQVRFVGNTAQIADARFRTIDPFQLKALAWWLERHAEKTLAASERRAAAEGITTPESEGAPGMRLIKPGDLRGPDAR